MWSKGTINGYTYCVKHFEEGSHFGIDEGKISKLEIRKDGKILYNYDRGLDFNRLDTKGETVLGAILSLYN